MAADLTDDKTASPWIAPVAVYGAFVIALIILLHPTALSMLQTWAGSSSYHHGFFAAPVAAWMIAARAPRPTATGGRIAGYIIILGGTAMWLAGRAAGVALIEQLAFISLLIGGVGAVFGGNALRAWAYPLAFLYFMVPFGAVLTPVLQTLTAKTVVGLLAAFGTPVSVDGFLIRTPAGAFEIAAACAGLRFLIAAVMVAAVFAYVSFASWRTRMLYLLFAVALAIIANGVRAFLMVLVATLTEMRWAVGPDHLLAGWVFYGLVFAVLIAAGRRFSDTAPMPAPKAFAGQSVQNLLLAGLPALAIAAAASIYGAVVIDRPVSRLAPTNLSLLNAPDWRILPPPENWRAHLPYADRTAAATYQRDDDQIYVSLGYFTHDRRGAEIVNISNQASDGDYWRHIATRNEVIYLFGRSEPHPILQLAGPERRRLAAVTVYWLDDQIYLKPWRLKRAQMIARLSGKNPAGGVIIIASSYNRDPADAIATIRAFTIDIEPLDKWLSRNGGA